VDRRYGWTRSSSDGVALFPTGRSGMRKIVVGMWRDDAHGPTQVVSGPVGKEKVHYEAPAATLLGKEMSAFLDWANDGGDKTDPVLKAAIAHLWFVTIHPFDDGNGRIARAIADWALARSENIPQRFYSMSAQIRHERNEYYDILEKTQKGTLDITPWLSWFLGCLGRAFDGTEVTLRAVLHRRGSGTSMRRRRSTVASATSSTGCSMDLKGSSQRPSGRRSKSAHTTRRSAIFRVSSSNGC
jgi:Fic family protein